MRDHPRHQAVRAPAAPGAVGGDRRLHQRRQVLAAQPADRRRRAGRGLAVRDPGPDHPQDRPPSDGRDLHDVRHRRLRPAPAAPARRGVPLDAGGGRRLRPGAARRRRLARRPRGPAGRGARGVRRDRRRQGARAGGHQQGRRRRPDGARPAARQREPHSVVVSAKTGEGIADALRAVEADLPRPGRPVRRAAALRARRPAQPDPRQRRGRVHRAHRRRHRGARVARTPTWPASSSRTWSRPPTPDRCAGLRLWPIPATGPGSRPIPGQRSAGAYRRRDRPRPAAGAPDGPPAASLWRRPPEPSERLGRILRCPRPKLRRPPASARCSPRRGGGPRRPGAARPDPDGRGGRPGDDDRGAPAGPGRHRHRQVAGLPRARRCSTTGGWWSRPRPWPCSTSSSSATSRPCSRPPTTCCTASRRTPCSRAARTTPACTGSARACPTTRAPWSTCRRARWAARCWRCGRGPRSRPRPRAPATGTRAPKHTDRVWRQVSVNHRECLGAAQVPVRATECFAERAKEKAAQSQLIVTNHSLLAIDAIEGVPMIPEYDVVVIDEAHELAARVTQAATDELSVPEVERTARRRAQRHVEGTEADDLADAAEALRDARRRVRPRPDRHAARVALSDALAAGPRRRPGADLGVPQGVRPTARPTPAAPRPAGAVQERLQERRADGRQLRRRRALARRARPQPRRRPCCASRRSRCGDRCATSCSSRRRWC